MFTRAGDGDEQGAGQVQVRAFIYGERPSTAPERFQAYTALSARRCMRRGATGGVAGVRPEVLEGAFAADRIGVAAFASLERARACYHFARVAAVKLKRLGAADCKMLLLD